MTPRHQASRAAYDLIIHFEGCRRKAARLADGRWTIGYGHTLTAREGAEVSPEDAEALLTYDLRPIAAALNEWIYTPLTQNQFDALVAFTYNVGLDNFRRSAVLRRVNEGALIQAACALEMWRKADFEGERIVVDALVRRRAAEKSLFLTPHGGWVPVPSPILRPRVDYAVGSSLPQSSADLTSPMDGETATAERVLRPLVPEAEAEEEPSASQVAAAAVTARLNAILPEEAPEQATAPVEAETAEPVKPAMAAAASLFSLQSPSAADPTPVEPVEEPVLPLTEPAPAIEPAPVADAPELRFEIPDRMVDADALSRRVVWRESPMETDVSKIMGGSALGRASPLGLGALFVAGLMIFAVAIALGLRTKGAGGVLGNPNFLSWGLGLVGIACVVSAIYFALDRLGGRDD